MPVSGHPIPRPQRQRPDTMGCAVEASPKRLRHHLRRPDADEGQLIMKPPLTPLIGPTQAKRSRGGDADLWRGDLARIGSTGGWLWPTACRYLVVVPRGRYGARSDAAAGGRCGCPLVLGADGGGRHWQAGPTEDPLQ